MVREMIPAKCWEHILLEGLIIITCQMLHLFWHSPLPQVGRYKSLPIRIMRSRFASANFWAKDIFRESLIRHC